MKDKVGYEQLKKEHSDIASPALKIFIHPLLMTEEVTDLIVYMIFSTL